MLNFSCKWLVSTQPLRAAVQIPSLFSSNMPLLAEINIDPNARDHQDATPLLHACYMGLIDMYRAAVTSSI